MNISLKHQIAERILKSEDDDLLNEIKSLIGLSESDFWDDLPYAVKQAIKKGEAELDSGLGIPDDDITKEAHMRFLKDQ